MLTCQVKIHIRNDAKIILQASKETAPEVNIVDTIKHTNLRI